MKPKPSHINEYVRDLPTNNKYSIGVLDDYTFAYEVKCINCSQEITVYDLNLYPAATPIKEDDELIEYISEEGNTIFNVCVIYEYSDEYEVNSAEFDENDIT